MPKYAHINNSQVAEDVAEELSLNRYHFQITPPKGIVAPAWLHDEIKSVGGLDAIDKLPEIVKQIARGHTRVFHSSFIDDTTLELTLTINLNAHGKKANDIVIYKMFKAIARRSRNEKTGANGLKRDSVFAINLEQTNKIGEIWRKIEGPRTLLQEMSGLDEASLENGEPVELSVTLRVEKWKPYYGGDAIQE